MYYNQMSSGQYSSYVDTFEDIKTFKSLDDVTNAFLDQIVYLKTLNSGNNKLRYVKLDYDKRSGKLDEKWMTITDLSKLIGESFAFCGGSDSYGSYVHVFDKA